VETTIEDLTVSTEESIGGLYYVVHLKEDVVGCGRSKQSEEAFHEQIRQNKQGFYDTYKDKPVIEDLSDMS